MEEVIVYLLRKTSLTLAEIKSFGLMQLMKIYNEVMFQESQDRWDTNYNLAYLVTHIHNAMPKGKNPRIWKIEDFYSTPRPTHEPEKPKNNLAEKLGIKVPEG